ncbi:GntR family transcriptional regulator [Geomicrobium sp. JCM 19055]|uniref:GntR family transcriptional regulator n=1 Tax=Geomicrobium sp. JCM 19055 TaxID=1460649 RepID=UPI00045ED2E5|nr:GntR family transcriptional regulator [Geomicrobium sp. JCM 19055]GAK01431.1 transcriptional regulator, GntR family [Geomicrobium sp. JCM 19055]
MINIDPSSKEPIYRQIVTAFKEQVARGVLEQNEKIPSVRELSSQIVVNPNTISKAYQELEREGIIITVRGRGTFIAEQVVKEIVSKDIEEVKEKVKQLVLEGYYAGIEKEVMQDWVACYYNQFGGKS